MRQRLDEVVRAGHLRRRLYFGIAGVQPAVANILAYRTGEEVRRLQHNADARLDGVQR